MRGRLGNDRQQGGGEILDEREKNGVPDAPENRVEHFQQSRHNNAYSVDSGLQEGGEISLEPLHERLSQGGQVCPYACHDPLEALKLGRHSVDGLLDVGEEVALEVPSRGGNGGRKRALDFVGKVFGSGCSLGVKGAKVDPSISGAPASSAAVLLLGQDVELVECRQFSGRVFGGRAGAGSGRSYALASRGGLH